MAPMLDGEGEKIGLFAIQVRLERINELMLEHVGDGSLSHYMVGEDGLLRTPLTSEHAEEVLVRQIDTEQFKRWFHERGSSDKPEHDADHIEQTVFYYRGPTGQQVIGGQQVIKKVNNNYGHPAGDAVLREAANLLKEQSRQEDVVTRFGGEEFVMILDHWITVLWRLPRPSQKRSGRWLRL